MNRRILTITLLIFTAALFRLLPHSFNFSPVGAIALFGGAILSRKLLAFIIPLAAMLFSDLFLGFYGMEMLVTYGAVIAMVFIGTRLNGNVKWYRVAGASVLSSVVFYLITNLVFLYPASHGALYSHTFSGMITSYVAGWPFFQNTLASDLLFNTLLFGGYYLLRINIPVLAQENAKAS